MADPIQAQEISSDDMVERVARAMSSAYARHSGNEADKEIVAVDFDAARAAIAAMREPTEAMVEAVDLELYSDLSEYDALTVWQQMIDEALR